MQQFSRIVLVGLGLGLVAVVLSSLPSHPVAAANGGPSVTVVAPLPLPVTGEGTPFATTLCDGTLGVCASSSLPGSYMIPANNHLIIEYTSVSCELDTATPGSSATVGQFGLYVTTAGVTNDHSIANSPAVVASAYPSLQLFSQWAQPVKLYGDPGTAVTFSDVLTAGGPPAGGGKVYCPVTISGRLTTP